MIKKVTTLIALVAFMVVGATYFASSAMGSTLSRVGPNLTPSNAKTETQFLLRHDRGVQKFLHLSRSSALKIKVKRAKRFKCRIGHSKRCPFNTGKRGTRLVQTSYRHGQWRWAYRVKFIYRGKSRYVTFHELSSNVLSGVKKKRAKRRKVTRKPVKTMIVFAFAQASATASCPGAYASATASATAVGYVTVKYKPSKSKWEYLISTLAKASASATAWCAIPPPPPPPPPPPTCPPNYQWNGTICAKDGTIGPGEGTPGQPGGPGAGGEPGNPDTGEVCRNTHGDIVSGPSDQFGYCIT